MNIIIPMTGYGSRFVAAGYTALKPFIKIFDKPILEWIVTKMYPGEKNFIFILKEEDVKNNSGIEKSILSFCPTGKVVVLKDWLKKGPVFDVMRATDHIPSDQPAIINYCDFYQVWDWAQFKKEVIRRQCEGCIPTYTGFHPHLIPRNNIYASCLVDERENLIEIREKHSFSIDKTKSRHSPGVYYFKTGHLLKKYCQNLIDENVTINEEYYASMPYNAMVRDGLTVWAPTNVKFFCQWGTPRDMEEFIFWITQIREK